MQIGNPTMNNRKLANHMFYPESEFVPIQQVTFQLERLLCDISNALKIVIAGSIFNSIDSIFIQIMCWRRVFTIIYNETTKTVRFICPRIKATIQSVIPEKTELSDFKS